MATSFISLVNKLERYLREDPAPAFVFTGLAFVLEGWYSGISRDDLKFIGTAHLGGYLTVTLAQFLYTWKKIQQEKLRLLRFERAEKENLSILAMRKFRAETEMAEDLAKRTFVLQELEIKKIQAETDWAVPRLKNEIRLQELEIKKLEDEVKYPLNWPSKKLQSEVALLQQQADMTKQQAALAKLDLEARERKRK